MPDTPRETAARGAGMQEEMAEVTRLTRAGRLDEATALIQRALGGGISPGAPAGSRQATRGPSPLSPSEMLPGGVRPPVVRPDLLRAPEAGSGGRFVAGSFTNRAGTRGYKLYIPSGAEGRDLPLVVIPDQVRPDHRLPRRPRRDRPPPQRGAGPPPVGRLSRAGDGAPGPGPRRARLHPLRLPRRRRASGGGALGDPRRWSRLVGREPARLVHRSRRPRRLGRDGALLPGAPARLKRPAK